MKRGPKHAAKPGHVAHVIPEHIAALEIVKSVRPDGSYVCVHDQELTECDECAPIALLADEESGQSPVAPGEPLPPFDSTLERIGEPIAEIHLGHTPAAGSFFSVPATPRSGHMPEDLSGACAALGLASEHVRKYTPLDAGRFRILTHGGMSITWPDDRDKYTARPLTQAQKDGVVTSTAHVVGSLQKASEAARKLKAAEPRK